MRASSVDDWRGGCAAQAGPADLLGIELGALNGGKVSVYAASCPQTHRKSSFRLAMVEVEQPTETRLASYRAKRCVVVARYCLGHDDLATNACLLYTSDAADEED